MSEFFKNLKYFSNIFEMSLKNSLKRVFFQIALEIMLLPTHIINNKKVHSIGRAFTIERPELSKLQYRECRFLLIDLSARQLAFIRVVLIASNRLLFKPIVNPTV